MDLPTLWFFILGFFFIGYFVLDGFDIGVGMTLPFLGRDAVGPNDVDRRVLINTIGPIWDLNETWVIVAGAVMFAAFPEWYATLFSGFYLLMLGILLALILRGVSFEYRHQRPEASWKRRFDRMIVIGSAVPAFLWGLVFANVVRGVPLDAGFNFTGSLLDLFNPFAILGGLTTLTLFFILGVDDSVVRHGVVGHPLGRRRCDAHRLVPREPAWGRALVFCPDGDDHRGCGTEPVRLAHAR